MRIKKTAVAIVLFSAIVIFAGIDFAGAQGYIPLVQIPGVNVPPGGTNLSLYLVGLYNFLLSVVGIVAVMMLIIGGMRYITAAGNQAAVSDAKDIITNALAGLLLAILSWVIVAEINPDVLYIKKPGEIFVNTNSADLGSCGTWDFATSVCTCKDGAVLIFPENVGVLDQNTCSFACKAFKHCLLPESNPCIANGASNDAKDYGNDKELCQCIDGEDVKPANSGTPCNTVCSVPAEAGTYDDGKGPAGEYHGISWRLKVGQYKINDVQPIAKGENFSVKVGEPVYFDFSEVRDCKGNLVHFAIKFEGGIPPWGIAPDKWCCMKYNPGCAGTWGVCCNNNGNKILNNPPHIGCLWNLPECKEDSYMNTPDSESENYPIYVYDSYSTVSSTKTPPAPEQVWVGMSVKVGGVCKEFKRVFRVDVTQ